MYRKEYGMHISEVERLPIFEKMALDEGLSVLYPPDDGSGDAPGGSYPEPASASGSVSGSVPEAINPKGKTSAERLKAFGATVRQL